MKNGEFDDSKQSIPNPRYSPSRWTLASPIKPLSSSLLSPGKYRGLVRGSTSTEGGQSLTSKLQAFMGGGKSQTANSSTFAPATATEIIHSVGIHAIPGQEWDDQSPQQTAKDLKKQGEINHINIQLAKLNYLVNIANFRKHKQIEKSLHEGQRQLQRLKSTIHDQILTIDRLSDSVTELSVEVEQQREICRRLTGSLDSERHLLEMSLLEARREMEHKHALLARQQVFLDKLIQQKLHQDILVDGGLVVTAIYLSNTILVNYPLQLILSVIPERKQQLWVCQMCKLVFVIKMVMFLRYCSVKCGLHNSAGSAVNYGQVVLRSMAQRIRRFITSATGLFKLRKDSKLDIC